jgi:putative tryptophan/tyrosine transport system substrate-binding protein
LKRREFITLLGAAAAAWPLVARAQQPALPVIGWMGGGALQRADRTAAFHRGLGEAGYVEGHNVAIEHRWADGRYERLPAFAADLVARQVAVISTLDTESCLAAKAATATIPIVFLTGSDPVKFGLVASINRPGGNITGVNFLANLLQAKQFGLVQELMPTARLIGFLANPTNPNFELDVRGVQEAAEAQARKLMVLKAANASDIETAFGALVQQQVEALFVNADPYLANRIDQIVGLATRHKVPAIYPNREYVDAGGLMSYGTSRTDSYRQVGAYVGRVLKGDKPADLPVMQSVKVELVINLKTARTLGLIVPPTLLAIADEVIE